MLWSKNTKFVFGVFIYPYISVHCITTVDCHSFFESDVTFWRPVFDAVQISSFSVENLTNFESSNLKLHNQYCHNCHKWYRLSEKTCSCEISVQRWRRLRSSLVFYLWCYYYLWIYSNQIQWTMTTMFFTIIADKEIVREK